MLRQRRFRRLVGDDARNGRAPPRAARLTGDEQVDIGHAVPYGRRERVEERAISGDRQLGEDVGRTRLDPDSFELGPAAPERLCGRCGRRPRFPKSGGARRADRAPPRTDRRPWSRYVRRCRARRAAGSPRSTFAKFSGRASRRCAPGRASRARSAARRRPPRAAPTARAADREERAVRQRDRRQDRPELGERLGGVGGA